MAGDTNPPSVAVVEAVASAEGVEPTELPLLSDAFDPVALDEFLRSATDPDLEIRFHWLGYEITVDGHHRVSLTDQTG